MVREDTGAPNDSGTCAWMAADEAVGCTRALLTMAVFSTTGLLRASSDPDLRVNDISRIHRSQNLLTTQSEWLN
ncbi:uncharacterized protein TNCV_2244631 [Trichonephila clavipes]|nr:uncharacterized protein TNCV_2244631 [Trichonephila clavipes]